MFSTNKRLREGVLSARKVGFSESDFRAQIRHSDNAVYRRWFLLGLNAGRILFHKLRNDFRAIFEILLMIFEALLIGLTASGKFLGSLLNFRRPLLTLLLGSKCRSGGRGRRRSSGGGCWGSRLRRYSVSRSSLDLLTRCRRRRRCGRAAPRGRSWRSRQGTRHRATGRL